MPYRSSRVPAKYKPYKIKNKFLLFESSRLLHKNAPWQGDRYAIVFFNKDLNYVNSRLSKKCQRSLRLLRKKRKQPITWLVAKASNRATPADIKQKRKLLVRLLDKAKFIEDRTSGAKPSSKYGDNRGEFFSFGVTKTRKNRTHREAQGLYTRKHLNQNNTKYADIYTALCDYVNSILPNFFGTKDTCKFHMCIVAKNSQCEWHHDAGNVGPAVITAVGNFKGGALWVEHEPTSPSSQT